MIALILVMLLGLVPVVAPQAQAISQTDSFDDGIQYAIFPAEYVNISRSNNRLHPSVKSDIVDGGHWAYAFDFAQTVSSRSKKLRAPFDMKVVCIGGSNGVYVESLRPVRFADGTVDYMSCVFIHDDKLDVKKGQIIKQGEYFYDMGNNGHSTGTHVHVEVGRGKGYLVGNSHEASLGGIRKRGVQANDAFFLKSDAPIYDSKDTFGGKTVHFSWKKVQEVAFYKDSTSKKPDLVRYYPEGDVYGSLPTPVKQGKNFAGWYKAKTGGTKISEIAIVGASTTKLYARWTNAATSNIFAKKAVTMSAKPTQTDAELKLSVNVGAVMSSYNVGFYIGTSPNYLTRIAKQTSVLGENLTKGIRFKLSDYGITLRPSTKDSTTTYYYQFYALSGIGGTEMRSEVKSFVTPKQTVQTRKANTFHTTWTLNKVTGITQNGATVSGAASFNSSQYEPKSKTATSVKVEKYGVYLGTDRDELTKFETTVDNTSVKTRKISHNLSGLKSGTTYYYRFFVIVGGMEYRSGTGTFKTSGKSQSTTNTSTLNPKWSNYKVAGITQNSATISTKVTYGKNVKVEKVGFYLGTASNKLAKSTVYDKVNVNRDYSKISYNLASKGVKLNAGTTYYYQFYTVVGGKEYKSAVKTFTTKSADTVLNPTWSKYKVTDISQTNANIAATVTYGKRLKADRCGFYLGTSQNGLTKAKKYDTITESRTLTEMSYDLNKYGHTLTPGTTYYYQFYIVISGKEYKSAIKTFTTKPADATLNLTWSNYEVTDISQTNARIAATVNYGKRLKADRCGFYLGTSQNGLTKAQKYDTITESRSLTNMWYDLNKYGHTLTPGTTYYYRFYIVISGKEYQSDIKSFTTNRIQIADAIVQELSPVWSDHKVSNVTKTNATVSAKVTYGKSVKPEKSGFYIGTSKDNLEKAEKFDSINAKRQYSNLSYGMNKYGYTLKAGTTYYYRFYVIVNGVEYLSEIRSFTTSK